MTGLHTILATEPLHSDISFGWVLFQKDMTPVPVGSQHLKSLTGGGKDLGHKKHTNLWIPTIKLLYKVIFTCIQVSTVSAGTCGHHLSRMGVLVSRII